MKDHDLNVDEFLLDEIESIELIGDRPTVDIEVEDTHMFYANDVYTHNSAHEEDVIEAHNVADSYRKIMTGDFVFSLSRKKDDKVSNTARIHIIKNRFGADGMTFPTTFDSSNGTVKIFDASSKEGLDVQSKMKSPEESLKEKMRNIHKNMWNKGPKSEDGEGD